MAAGKKKKSKRQPDVCPNCRAEKTSQIACVNCGYEYSTGTLNMSPTGSNPQVAPTDVVSDSKTLTAPSKILERVLLQKSIDGAPVLQAVLLVDTRRREYRPVDETPPADRTPKVFVMDQEVLSFGRTSNWMQIKDAGVSRSHGEFIKQGDGSYCIRDIGSSNGLHVNGKKIGPQELRKIKPGDEIEIGFWHVIQITWGHS